MKIVHKNPIKNGRIRYQHKNATIDDNINWHDFAMIANYKFGMSILFLVRLKLLA